MAFGTDLAGVDAIAILEQAPTPAQGRSISQAKLVSALRKAGRERPLELKAAEIQGHLRAPQLEVAPLLTQAFAPQSRYLRPRTVERTARLISEQLPLEGVA